MRITKYQAEEAAKSMMSKRAEKLKSDKEKFKTWIRDSALNDLPKSVRENFENKTEESTYYSTKACVTLRGVGISTSIHVTIKPIPNNQDSWNPILNLNDKDAVKAQNLYQKNDAENLEINRLQEDIANTLYNLKTFKNVQESFAEALDHLPASVKPTSELAIPIETLRKRINHIQQ
jgi:hypothetical protein